MFLPALWRHGDVVNYIMLTSEADTNIARRRRELCVFYAPLTNENEPASVARNAVVNSINAV